MQYLPNSSSPWLTYAELVPAVMTAENFRQAKGRGNLRASCAGGQGRTIFIEWESMEVAAHRKKVLEVYGDPYQYIAMQGIRDMVKVDESALKYYAEYTLPSGRPLPLEYQMRLARQCDILNVITTVMANKSHYKEALGITMEQFWEDIVEIARVDESRPCLPTTVRTMRRKWAEYDKKGKAGLIEVFRFDNGNARKVEKKHTDLWLALQDQAYGPTLTDVHRTYKDFIQGRKEIVHLETGEVFDPKKYYVKGKADELSRSTVKGYMSKIGAKAVTDKKRMSNKEWNDTYRPHMMGKAPFFAMSKVSMDDTSSPFKMPNGKRPATYKMFDLASEALVGMVMHRDDRPDHGLIRRMIRDFVWLIASKGWKMPYEVEMERALTSSMKGTAELMDVFFSGAVFPYIRWCLARNPQEKGAENIIKRIKYGYQRKRDGFQKRPFAKLTMNRENEDGRDIYFDYEEIERMEREDMHEWNHSLHSNQELYPGMTRWEVLEQNQNPNLALPQMSLIMPYVGNKTKTSVNRMRMEVNYKKYNLPESALLDELNDRDVTAYWMPDGNGEVPSVWVYQDGRFVCEAAREDKFQRAKVEQTDEDVEILNRQRSYRKEFDSTIKEKRSEMMPVGVVNSERGLPAPERPTGAVATTMLPAEQESEPVWTKEELLRQAAEKARQLM